jgi:type IV secretory pathway TrbF-like protein
MDSKNGIPPMARRDSNTTVLPYSPHEVSDHHRLILAGYDELRRRDTLGVHDKWHWKLLAMGLLLYCGVITAMAFWLALKPQTIQAPVQLVQVNHQGQVEPLGPPQDLLAYTPTDAQWMQLVSDWVLKRRWKGSDAPLAAANVAWLQMHTCKPALEDLRRWEKVEKPLEIGKRRVQVELMAVTKTDAPKAYNVLWKEWITDGTQPTVEQRWAGTFTVGRLVLRHQEMVLHNRLGQCVTASSWAQQP